MLVAGLVALSAAVRLAATQSAGDRTPRPTFGTVPWTELRFSAHKFFLSASTTLRVARVESASLAAKLRVPPRGVPVPLPSPEVVAVSSDTDLPFGRSETVTVWLDPSSGAAVQVDKLAHGREPYRKVFRYTTRGAYMWRTSPANAIEAGGDPGSWTHQAESMQEATVAAPAGSTISESYALVYLASAARLDRSDIPVRLLILSGAQLVELTFTPSDVVRRRLTFDETWPGGSRRHSDETVLRRVKVSGRPLESSRSSSDVDLGFLGMRGDLTILVEVGTGIPAEISGHAEHIGALTVRLDRVALSKAPTEEPQR